MVNESATIRFPIFDFPGMQLKVNGVKVDHWSDDCRGQEYCLGLITWNFEKGEYETNIELIDTIPRRFGNYLTLISIGVVMFMLVYAYKNERKTK